MVKSVSKNLDTLTKAVEELEAEMPRLTKEEQIDVCARIVSAKHGIERMESDIKAHIWTWRRKTVGYVPGELFKAYLNIFPVSRFNLEKFKLEHPRIHPRFVETAEEGRITFDAR